MTVYAPSDHTNITVPAERGGCGVTHDTEGGVTCPECEPILLKMGHGWAATREGVSLTPDEIGETERAERDAKRQQNLTWGDSDRLAKTIASAIGSTPPAEAPTLLGLVKTMTPAERAELAALFAADQAALAPAAEAPAEEAEPVKRGPGRPRTARAA